jgi:RNA-binding protein 5/10
MAYNREWDMGKETCKTMAHGLETVETRTMEREEEEIQRRGTSATSSSLSLTHGILSGLGRWRTRLHHNYQDYGVAGGGFHGHKKRLVASDPSPHVIFLGLDTGFTESDVCGIVHHYSLKVHGSWPTASYVFDRPRLHN